ncbi:hypothetical protein Pelo_9513 [Pelomyxa schiedti]|nr:hypothetical protein Pelo_9513 [Pelomyxa schiedti]
MLPFGSADNNSLRTTSSISRCTSSLNNQRTQQPQFPQQVSTPNFYSPSVDIHISAQHFAPAFHAPNSCNTRNTKPTPEFGAMDRLAAFNQQFTVSKSRQQQEAPTHVNSSYDDSLSSISDCTSTSSTSSPSSTSFTSSTSSSSSPFSSSYSFSPSSPFSPIPPWLQGPRNDYPQQQQQQVQNQQQPCEEWKPTPLFRTSSAPDLMYGGNPFSRNTTPCPSLSRATVSQSLSYSGGLSSMSGTQHPLAMSTTPPSSPSPAGTAPSTPLIMSPVSPSNMSPGTPIVPPCNRSGTPPLPVDECPVSPQPPALSPSPPVRDSSNATPTYTLGGSTASLSSASFHRPSPEMTPSGFFATLSLNTPPTVNTSQETGGSDFVSSLSSVKGRLFCDEGDYSTSPLPSARKSGKIRRLKSKSSDGTSTPFRSSSMNRIPMVTPPTPPLAANPRSIEPIPFGIAPRRPASTPPADEDTCSMSRERREPPSPYKPSPKLRSSEPISHWEKHKLPRCSSYDSLLLEAHEPPLQAIPCPLFSSNNTSSSIQGIPTFRGKGTTNNCISPETLRDLIKGLFGAHVHKVVIFDCRFPYEYAGGHITNAINLTGSGVEEVLKTYFTEEKLAEADQVRNSQILFY